MSFWTETIMNSKMQFGFLAATNDAGILQHDIVGIIVLVALLLLGIVFAKRQQRLFHKGAFAQDETQADRKFGRVQLWALYWLAVGVAVTFFFVMPRATSQKAQPSAEGSLPQRTAPK